MISESILYSHSMAFILFIEIQKDKKVCMTPPGDLGFAEVKL